jgi:hypothetical protein
MAHNIPWDASITRRTKKMPHKDPEAAKEYARKYRQENKKRVREGKRKWYQENKEKVRETSRKWYQENAEKHKESSRMWQQENPEKRKEYRRKWLQENAEKHREIVRKWQQENPEKRNANAAKRRASKLQRTPHWLTEDEVFMIKEAYSLAKLREKTTGIKWHVDHIVPLQGDTVSGLHCPENLQVIPGSENISKKNNWNWDEQR